MEEKKEPVKETATPAQTVTAISIITLFVYGLYSCMGQGSEKPAAPVAPVRPAITPEMIVKIAAGKTSILSCVTKDLLEEEIGHAVRHETTKQQAMFANLDCIIIPSDPTMRFKILSTGYGVVEFVNTKSNQSIGLWTYVESFDPA